jgi:hypothetical protein
MNKAIRSFLALGVSLILVSLSHAAYGAEPSAMVIVNSTSKPRADVVAAIKAYAEEKKWAYLGENKTNGGAISLVKVCIPQIGKAVWDIGFELAALLPCGNIAIYERDGKTEVSMLSPLYMNAIYPHPKIKQAGEDALPMFKGLLDNILQ